VTLELPLPTNPSDLRAYVDALLGDVQRTSPERAAKAQKALTGQFSGSALLTNQAIFAAMLSAGQDVKAGRLDAPIYAVQASTGAGKTTGACALIKAQFDFDHGYTAAVVTGTIKGAQDTFDFMSKLLGTDGVYLYTSAHECGDDAIEDVRREYGNAVASHRMEFGKATTAGLMAASVVVCTHERWKADTISGDKGVVRSDRGPRRNIFIDEQPNLVNAVEVAPSDVEYLREQFDRLPLFQPLMRIVNDAVSRMKTAFDRDGSPLEATSDLFEGSDLPALFRAFDTLPPGFDDRATLAFDFLKAANSGNSFIVRDGKRDAPSGLRGKTKFWSYSLGFKPHSGLIILDATAALSSVATLLPNISLVQVEPSNYRNLEITHIEAPAGFEDAARSIGISKAGDAAYVEWINEVVRNNTAVGDRVLVVLHKRYSAAFQDAQTSSTISDRLISCTNWGAGVGSNEWRECTHVFLFSEYHLPAPAYICDAAALQGATADSAVLDATHRTGSFKRARDGHRLRWFKQMASRGTVRNIDDDGVCKQMKLFTSMERRLFIEHWQALFPGSSEPRFQICPLNKAKKKPQRLADYLLDAQERGERQVYADEIARVLKINVKDIRRSFDAAGCSYIKSFGWTYPEGQPSRPALYRVKFNAAGSRSDVGAIS
jgi:hypothetical protein